MPTRNLRTFTTVLLLVVTACTPTGEPGATDPGTTEASTTGTSTGDVPTSTEAPTTGSSSTSGDSESASESTGETGSSSGTTVDATTEGLESSSGSTGEESSSSTGEESSSSTGEESSSSTGDESSSSTGEPVVPVGFDECRQGDASMCPAEDPACLTVDGPGGFGPDGSFFVTWSYCSRECDVDADCVSGPQGGTAKPLCVPKGPNMVKVCVLDCSFGKTCPDALECANDDTCGTRFCDCEDAGCQDSLCTG